MWSIRCAGDYGRGGDDDADYGRGLAPIAAGRQVSRRPRPQRDRRERAVTEPPAAGAFYETPPAKHPNNFGREAPLICG